MDDHRHASDPARSGAAAGTAAGVDAANAFLRQLIPLPGAGAVEPLPLLPMAALGRTLPSPQATRPDATARVAEPAASIVAQAMSILDEEMARGVVDAHGRGAAAGDREAVPFALRGLQDVVDSLSRLWPGPHGGAGPAASTPPPPATAGLPTLSARGRIAPGQQVDILMTLHNREERALRLVPTATDLVCSDGGRISAAGLAFSPAEATLQPQEKKSLVISVRVPPDAAPGRYAGLLIVKGADELRALVLVDVGAGSGAALRSSGGTLTSAATRESPLLQEAARLAADGELGNSDAIHLLHREPTSEEIRAVIARHDRQLTRQARGKLTLAAAVPLPAGVPNQRYEPIFDRYPVSGRTYTTRSGTRVLNEVQYYNGEVTQLHGECRNVAAVRGALAGSGCRPMTTVRADGSERAIVQLWFNRFTDTSIGPYEAMFIIVAATPADAPASQACIRADESGVSSVLPMLDGHFDPERQSYENQAQLYFVRLLDSTQIAIDVGRERMGTDKHAGTLDFGASARQRTISARTGAPQKTGEAVARLSFTPATDAMVCVAPLARAAATAGIAVRELPPGTECVYTAVARIGDGPVVRWQWRTDVLPRLQPATPDMIHLNPASTEGKLLLEWGFEARVLGYVPNVRGVATGLV